MANLKKKSSFLIMIIVSVLALFLTSFFVINKGQNKKISSRVLEFIDSLNYDEIIEEVKLDQKITSILIKKDNAYKSYLYSDETNAEIEMKNILKEEKTDDFKTKIQELLYLKYPKFIADALTSSNGQEVYHFRKNELVIYYYNFNIIPAVQEELFLKVNYNEIYDCLNFSYELDSAYKNENGWDIDPHKKIISITFDDGPSALTDELVDILNANHAQATFFMVGNRLEEYSSQVRYVYSSKHEIGYHTYNHQNLKKEKMEDIISELNKSNEILNSLIGANFKLMRPPYGALNEEIKNNLQLSFILWSLDSEDWRYKDKDRIVNYTLTNIKEGDIVLYHDLYSTTIEAIKEILPELYVRGFQVVSVSSLANLYNKEILSNNVYHNFS